MLLGAKDVIEFSKLPDNREGTGERTFMFSLQQALKMYYGGGRDRGVRTENPAGKSGAFTAARGVWMVDGCLFLHFFVDLQRQICIFHSSIPFLRSG
jgi:hypothetical protein